MITIEKAGDYRRCQCCHSDESVREISFRADHVGTVVALCARCRRELERALYVDGREFFKEFHCKFVEPKEKENETDR